MKNSLLLELGVIIDNAIDQDNEEELNTIITIYSDYAETLEDSIEKCYTYYLLGNAYSGLRNIFHQKNEENIWKLEQEEIFKEIYYFRKSIKSNYFNNLDLSLQLAIYANLGNVFSHYGRIINAIKYYDKAISLKIWNKNIINNPNYFMALINKQISLYSYFELDYDIGHKDLFLKFSYKLLKEAMPLVINYLENFDYDKVYYSNIKNQLESKLEYFENSFLIEDLENIDCFLNYKKYYSKNETIYRNWCLSNNLFLNSLNDLGNYIISSHDSLSLPNVTTEINEGFPKIITNFNQLKQEYITYRYLLFEGIYNKTFKFYDKETSITNDYDYNIYNINVEKIKLAFRGFYSIFDKIANFIFEYFINIETKKNIDFRNVWLEEKSKKLNDLFNQTENLALRGLFLISKDLFYNDYYENSKEFLKVLEPESEEINYIRNQLEHKFISIKILDTKKYKTSFDRKRDYYITENALEEKTLHLAQLVRESMIYLSFAIHIEESRKEKIEKIVEIPLTTY